MTSGPVCSVLRWQLSSRLCLLVVGDHSQSETSCPTAATTSQVATVTTTEEDMVVFTVLMVGAVVITRWLGQPWLLESAHVH